MIILLYGPDDYRREQKRKDLIAEFHNKHSGLGFAQFDLEEEDALGRLEEFARSQSIFEPLKLAYAANAFAAEEKKLAAILKPLLASKSTTVLLSEKNVPPKPLAFLRPAKGKNGDGALAQEFETLKGEAWRKFIRAEAEKKGLNLAPAALELLAQAYGGDSWRLVTELEKLALLSGRQVEKKDLEALAVEITPDFWGTMYGLRSPRVGERLATLEKLFIGNEPAGKIFNILSAQWQEKLPAFAAYDTAVKTGRCDYEEVLLDLALG